MSPQSVDLFSVLPIPRQRQSGESYQSLEVPRPRLVKDLQANSWNVELQPRRPTRRCPPSRGADPRRCLLEMPPALAAGTTASSPDAPPCCPAVSALRAELASPGSNTGGGAGDAEPLVSVISPQYGTLKVPARAARGARRRMNRVLGSLPPLRPNPPRSARESPAGSPRSTVQLSEVLREMEEFEKRLDAMMAKETGEKRPVLGLTNQGRLLRAARKMPPARIAQVVRLRHGYMASLLRATTLKEVRVAYIAQQGNEYTALDRVGLKQLLATLVPTYPLSNDQVAELFNIFDEDGSGVVSYTEFFGTVGSIIADPEIEKGIFFFWHQFETERGTIPMQRIRASNVEAFCRRHLPPVLALKWIHLGQELELALQRHPPPRDCIGSLQQLRAVVYGSEHLAECFKGLVPPSPRRGSVDASEEDVRTPQVEPHQAG
eukprot:TRINITY_DN4605_c1_g1_i1.p1 TRINITY_DN4605_c1_g1~~TRINITY_DN4605_c1_g1_i1.p1  ORF type:complete len:434 (+),score=118.45 TRINITY_DN4605_c1_g1_i1:86-1387(+)